MDGFLRAFVADVSPLLTAVDSATTTATPKGSSICNSSSICYSSSIGNSSSSTNNDCCSSPNSSHSPGVRGSGLLFLGCGSSASMPQLNHTLPFASPSHPFHSFASGEAPLPPVAELQRLAVAHRRRLKQQQQQQQQTQHAGGDPAEEVLLKTPSIGSDRGICGVGPRAAAGTTACGPPPGGETPVEELEGPALELAARESRNAACVPCLKGFLHADSPNRRRNISLVLYVEGKRLLIDCGKTIRDSLLRFCCRYNLSSIDGLFLTHNHMDAVGGLDDLRDLQPFNHVILPPSVTSTPTATGQPTPTPATTTATTTAAAQPLKAEGTLERGDKRWYAPASWIRCFLGARTFVSVCRSYSYLLRPYVEHCTMRETLTPTPAAQTPAAADAAADAAAPTDSVQEECLFSKTEDGEFGMTTRGRLLMKRKVACIDFTLLNDTVLPPRAEAMAAAETSPTKLEALMLQLSPEARLSLQRNAVQRSLRWAPTDPWGFSPLSLPGVRTPILSFPIYHGGTYVCLGLISLGAEPFLLLSDVTAVPPAVLERLLELPRPEVLVLDALGENPHAAHFCLQEALDLGVQLQPRRLYFVGMDCSLEYYGTNRRLSAWLAAHRQQYKRIKGVESRIEEVSLAHDGLFLSFATDAQ